MHAVDQDAGSTATPSHANLDSATRGSDVKTESVICLSKRQREEIQRLEAFLAQVERSVHVSSEEQPGGSMRVDSGPEVPSTSDTPLGKCCPTERKTPMLLDHQRQNVVSVPSNQYSGEPSSQHEAAGHPPYSEKAAMSRATEKKNFTLLVLNGPNLNLLGIRETALYGRKTLAEIETLCRECIQGQNVTLRFFQSNHEGILVEHIQQARGTTDLIIINPAAYTHTSVAIRDALLAVKIPVIEVHLSNIHKREPFRHHSYISDIALGQIAGFGPDGYRFAVEAGVRHLLTLNHHPLESNENN